MKVITSRPIKVIAAYPCLGKTTIYQANKDKCFDLEFNESRATRYMYGVLEKKMYFDAAAEMTMIIWNYGEYSCKSICHGVFRYNLNGKLEKVFFFLNFF